MYHLKGERRGRDIFTYIHTALIFPRFHGHRVKIPSLWHRTRRGTVYKGRMSADSIIEYFDPFENVLPGFFAGPIALMMHVFCFQRMKEAFHHGIVPAVPTPTHARRQAVFGEQCAVRWWRRTETRGPYDTPRRALVVGVPRPW
jgi:hypothetical protein